jgi:hypothetical protein
VTSAAGWQVPAGDPITASLIDPPGGLPYPLGARVEVPYTREIRAYYQLATLANGLWTVTLTSVPEPGGYEFVWRTNDAEPPYYEVWIPLTITGSASSSSGGSASEPWPEVDQNAVKPTPDDVAVLERTRIVGPGGGDPGTFDDTTHPTDSEVALLIEQAVDHTLNLLPYALDPRHYEALTRAMTLYAATLVEASYFREQIDEGSVRLYREMFEEAIASINARVAEDYRQAALATEDGTTDGAILA